MASLDTKKKVIAQAGSTITPQATPTLTSNTPSPVTGGVSNVTTNSNNAPKVPGSPGALTGSNTSINPMARTVTPQASTLSTPVTASTTPSVATASTTSTTKPPSIYDQFKPTIDQNHNADKEYLDKWQQAQNDRLDNEYKNSLAQLETSKADVDKWYNGSKGELGEELYNQMERTNVEGTNRGISYSPQFLGLQGVHNINYNKNLTKLMEQKSTLLNDINNKINSLNTDYTSNKNDLSLGLLDKQNSLNKDYNDILMDLYKDQYDKNWEEYMYGKSSSNNSSYSSGYGSGGGYSSGYSSSFTPYSTKIDGTDITSYAGGMEAKQASTDIFNEISNSTDLNVNNYLDVQQQYRYAMADYANALGLTPQEFQDEMGETMRTTEEKLYQKAYSNSTNTPYVNTKGVSITPALPYRKETIANNKGDAIVVNSLRKNEPERLTKYKSKIVDDTRDIHKKVMANVTDKQKFHNDAKKKAQEKNTPKAYKPVSSPQNGTKAYPQTTKKQNEQSVKNSTKKSVVKKSSTTKAKASKAQFNKKQTSKSAENLKKNIVKAIDKIKSLFK